MALPLTGHRIDHTVCRFGAELGVVLPCWYFGKSGQAHFNAVATMDVKITW